MNNWPSIITLCLLFNLLYFNTIAQTRDCDPIVSTGVDLPCMNGEDPQDIVAFKYENGTGWVQIPMQVDERILLDIVSPYDPVEIAAISQCLRNSTRNIVWNVLFYADAKTHVGADTNANFDDDDELVVMAKDMGDQRVGTAYPSGTIGGSLCELVIKEPLNSNAVLGYVYLFLQNGSLDQAAGADYITYNFTYANNYLTNYVECPNPNMNLENSTISTNNYELGFSERWTEEDFKIKVGDDTDILDRHQMFINPGSCGSTEDGFSDQEGAHIAAIDGPVRAIRSVMGTSSGPFTQLDLIATECQVRYNLFFRLHPANGFNDVYDMNAYASGKLTYYSEQNQAGAAVDGNNDALDKTDPDDWAMYEGTPGSLIISWDYDTDMTIGTAAQYNNGNSNIYDCDLRAYYDDKGGAASHPCTGDNNSYGSSGFTLRTKSCTDPKYDNNNQYPECVTSPFYFEINRVHYARPPGATIANAMQYDQYAKNPLVVMAMSDPLPVELKSFKTQVQKDHIALLWSTASEMNNSHFEIERSEDGKAFKNIGEVKGNGTTLEQQDYEFEDRQLLLDQLYYYRLKQVDFDGAFEYSSIQSATLEGENNDFKVYPNPVNDNEQIRVEFEAENKFARFQIFNIYGSVVKEIRQDLIERGKHLIAIDIADLPSGVYFLHSGDGEIAQFVKQ